ncbi:MAG: Hsp70 family protein [Myxococcota bacterium]|jgi:molecular chaperone DnaK|nr:Hsp70 family protein [Myxococcota bacterium]
MLTHIIGIDLGTTNSCVALVDKEGPRVLSGAGDKRTVPSVVALTAEGKCIAGSAAHEQAITNPENTFYSFKRLIGRRWNSRDTQEFADKVAFNVSASDSNAVEIDFGGKKVPVVQISAMLLEELKSLAEEALGEDVEYAVVTVPAHFNDRQRQATRDAAKIAGLTVVRIINEPTAAALAYGFGKKLGQRVAIYDIGGGTFDISLLDISDGVFEVLATAGDANLGGDDFDHRIVDWIFEEIEKTHGVDLRAQRDLKPRIKQAAEKMKVELTGKSESNLSLPYLAKKEDGTFINVDLRLNREKLSELVEDLVHKTIEICQKALDAADIQGDSIDQVILIGGMSRMLTIQAAVEDFFGVPPSKAVHPDEAVACGAAVQGYMLKEGELDTLLLDVTPQHLGLVVTGNKFETVIEKDTTVPARSRKIFTTTRDNQESLKFQIAQSSDLSFDEFESLGEFLLPDLKSLPAGTVKIEVVFEVDTDGIVQVSATDKETEKVQNIEISGPGEMEEHAVEQIREHNRTIQGIPVVNAAGEVVTETPLEPDVTPEEPLDTGASSEQPDVAEKSSGVDEVSEAEDSTSDPGPAEDIEAQP